MTTPDQFAAATFLEVKRLAAELAELKAMICSLPIHAEGWMSPSDAANALRSEGVKSAAHLKSLRLAGAFDEARGEIRNIGKGSRPVWQYNIPKCKTALQRYFKRLAG